MEKRYFDEILDIYLVRPDKYNDKKVCLEYSDGDMHESMGKEYQAQIKLLLWEKKPSNKMFKEVKLLKIDPARMYLHPENTPDFIHKFENLETLTLPLVFALQLKYLSPTVKYLTLINDNGQTYNLGDTKKEIKNNLQFGNVVFPSVYGLSIITLSSADMIADGFMNINESKFPNLKFLRCIMNPKDKFNPISGFTNLKYLWVTAGKGSKLFESAPKSLISLYIDGVGEDIDFSQISRLENLEILYINSCYSTFDCSLLKSLPGLKEIILTNTNAKFIENVESLLEIPQLKSLEISYCKNISAKTKQLLSENKDKFKRFIL